MASRRFKHKPPSLPCSEWDPAEDGVDPRLERPDRPERPVNRKALQLCRQVERILQSVLMGEAGDDLLRDLEVHTVVPAPDSTRLCVSLIFHGPEPVEPRELAAHVERARPMLRLAIGSAIHRKKVPDLTFQILK